ncbi:MAG: endonuclease MutS2, partial [Chloroflexi bacterium]|nr:endonuclease MutS2 [Chloroflexota bacterium]
MDRKTLATLEFHKIQERLARHTSFAVSRELALCLEPSADLDQVSRWQSCTAEAVKLLEWRPNLSLSSAEDIQPFIHRASLGGTVRPDELLAILKTLRLARTTADTILRLKRDLPFLAEIAQRVRPCPKVERQISQSINDRGEVVDDASPELRRLRQEVRSAHDQLLQRL